jgi:uncharacterized protein with FMN-binding domain
MRRAVIAIVVTIAGLIPLLAYHPSATHVADRAGAPPVATGPPAPRGTTGSTVDGSTVDTDFGPYQVRVTFSGATIVDVAMITEPGDRHSQRIANRAAPILREEALRAQSGHIDSVSGATATSVAYAQSLQAAIDSHHG